MSESKSVVTWVVGGSQKGQKRGVTKGHKENQDYNEVLPDISQNGHHQKATNNKEDVEKKEFSYTGRNGNVNLMGM